MKKIFLIFGIGLFTFFLLPNTIEAACPIDCMYCSATNDCRWGQRGEGTEYAGILGAVEDIGGGYMCETSWYYGPSYPECSDPSGKCKKMSFPSGGYNGQSCTAKDGCFSWFSCNIHERTGVWDASESKCVSCVGYKENRIYGDTSNIYARCDIQEGNLGNGRCESACGAVASCDDKNPGESCGTGLICSDTCQCVVIPTTGSGLKSCEYMVESRSWWGGTSWGAWATTLGWSSAGTCGDSRLITLWQTITVGPSGLCRDQGPQTCRVSVKAEDNAGYGSGTSSRVYNIDWTRPTAQ